MAGMSKLTNSSQIRKILHDLLATRGSVLVLCGFQFFLLCDLRRFSRRGRART